MRRVRDQDKRLGETAHIPCETTNLAVAGTVAVRLQSGRESPRDAAGGQTWAGGSVSSYLLSAVSSSAALIASLLKALSLAILSSSVSSSAVVSSLAALAFAGGGAP